MRAFGWMLVASLGLATSAAGCGSKPAELDSGRAQRDIGRTVSRAFHQPVDRPSCPSRVKVRSGDTFRCTVHLAGQTLRVRVVQLDRKGNLRVDPLAAVVDISSASSDLSGRLRQRFQRQFHVDCGSPDVRVMRPGSRFSCRATDATSRRTIVVTVRDVRGSLDYTISP